MNLKINALKNSNVYVIFGPQDVPGRDVSDILTQTLQGGADIIQLRSKSKDKDYLKRVAEIFRKETHKYNALFIMNDDPVLAIEFDADGVHVGQGDMSIDQVRGIVGKELLVGKSTHSLEQAKEAQSQDVDYLGFGPIFSTPTKPDYKAVGLGLLPEINNLIDKPFFAIGGIHQGNAAEVLNCGAQRLAIVRAIVQAPDVVEATQAIKITIGRALTS